MTVSYKICRVSQLVLCLFDATKPQLKKNEQKQKAENNKTQYFIYNICFEGYFEVYSQSNLLDRMLRQHSYQPCPQDFLTKIQYNPQDGTLLILPLIGVI